MVRGAEEVVKQLASEVAKFAKDDKTLGRKDDKSVSGKDAISRHSERQRRNPAYYNLKQLQNNQNSFSETDHTSMPLGIFASKSVSHKTNLGGVGTPPYVAKLVSCRHSNADLRQVSSSRFYIGGNLNHPWHNRCCCGFYYSNTYVSVPEKVLRNSV